MSNYWLKKVVEEEAAMLYYWMCLRKFNFDKSIVNHMQRKLLAHKPKK